MRAGQPEIEEPPEEWPALAAAALVALGMLLVFGFLIW
jgi:hypothetical protein